MDAKFKSFSHLLKTVDEKINDEKSDLEWYKFKVEQIANRATPRLD